MSSTIAEAWAKALYKKYGDKPSKGMNCPITAQKSLTLNASQNTGNHPREGLNEPQSKDFAQRIQGIED